MVPFRALFLFLIGICAASGLCQPFTIESYDVRLQLTTDRSMHVVETIRTRFNEQRHGIIRNIPYHYDTDKGFARTIFIDNVSVTEEGAGSIPVKIWRENDNLNIRTGDKDIFFPPGTKKSYVISYDVRGMLNWFELESWEPTVELYWNLTGDQWDTNIERTTFSLEYPGGVSSVVATRLFYGPYGSKANLELKKPGTTSTPDGAFETTLSERSVSGIASSGLGFHEGWTVVLALKEKVIPKPTFLQEAIDFMRSNPIVIVPFLTLLGLTIGWALYGRDPKPGPMVVQFEPPHALSAAECGAFLDQKVDRRDIAAGFVDLATRGYITIEIEENKSFLGSDKAKLHITGKGDPITLPPFERELYEKLQSCGEGDIDDSDLKLHVGPHIGELTATLYRSLVDKGYYRWNPNSIRGCLYVVGGIFLVGACCGNQFIGSGMFLVNFVSLAIAGIAFLLFARIMPRRTGMGVRAWSDVRGLEEFIRRARKDELDYMSKTNPDQALFEQLLPYAVAFGLTKEWTDAFKNIELHSPDWYIAPRGYIFNPYGFTNSIMSSTNNLASAASTPPRSAGGSGGHSGFSSGGGFSGGGFGGGGGSSW